MLLLLIRDSRRHILTVKWLDSREALVPPPIFVQHALHVHSEESVGGDIATVTITITVEGIVMGAIARHFSQKSLLTCSEQQI